MAVISREKAYPETTSSVSPALNRSRSRWTKDAWQLLSLPFILLIGIPIIALFARITPADVLVTLQQEQAQQAIRVSMTTSLTTVLVTLILGTPVAYQLSHPQARFHRVLDTLIDLPTVLPPAVAGLALLMAFGRRGLLGEWFTVLGFTIPFTPVAVILAQTFIAAPLYIKSAALGFSNVNAELRRAATMDGANRWQVFRYVIVPMSWMALLSGCVLTWARALGEFGATIIFAGNFPGRTQTMPLAIYLGFEIDLNVALTLSAILIGLSFAILILVKRFLYNRIETSPMSEEY
jgi:molybdate transport system permease protein